MVTRVEVPCIQTLYCNDILPMPFSSVTQARRTLRLVGRVATASAAARTAACSSLWAHTRSSRWLCKFCTAYQCFLSADACCGSRRLSCSFPSSTTMLASRVSARLTPRLATASKGVVRRSAVQALAATSHASSSRSVQTLSTDRVSQSVHYLPSPRCS
jgi:hypothetical protein